MNTNFNAEEILEIAIQIEKNGANYYRRASELVTNQDNKKLLTELADMEDSHEITFENMRGNPDVLSQLLGDVEGPAVIYLKAIADGHIFKRGCDPLKNLHSDVTMVEIIEKAISMELASIAFYQGILEGVTSDLDKIKIKSVIHEEMSHVVLLSERLQDINV